jgi:serine/threonine-protein kinase
LQHRAIVVVYDLGEADQMAYLATELLTGTDLRKLIEQSPNMPVAAKLEAMAEVCEALGYAHRKGVLHRNVKPGNLFLMDDKRIKVLDFGVTRLFGPGPSVAGQLLGTPNYMAPEEILGKPVDSRADLFAAAVACFEFLVHVHPFRGEFIPRRIVDGPPDSLIEIDSRMPAILDKVFARALAKNPAERYATGEELAADLRTAIDALRQQASRPSSGVQPPLPGGTAAPKTDLPAPPSRDRARAVPSVASEDTGDRHPAQTIRLTPEFVVPSNENGGNLAGALAAQSEAILEINARFTNAAQPDRTEPATMELEATPPQERSVGAGPAAPPSTGFEPEPRSAGEVTLPPAAPQYCPNCNSANWGDTAFCVECGVRLVDGATGPVPRPDSRAVAAAPAVAGIHGATPAATHHSPPPTAAPAATPSHPPKGQSYQLDLSQHLSAQSVAAPRESTPVSRSAAFCQSAIAVAEAVPAAEEAQPEPAALPDTEARVLDGPLPGVRSSSSAAAADKPVFESVLFGIRSGTSAPAPRKAAVGTPIETPRGAGTAAPDVPVIEKILLGIRSGASRLAPHKVRFEERALLAAGNISAPAPDAPVFERPLFGTLGSAATVESQVGGKVLWAMGVGAVFVAGIILLFAFPSHPAPSAPVAAAPAAVAPAPVAPAPVAPAAAAPAVAAVPPAPTGGKIASARLLYRTEPAFPANARLLVVRGEMSGTSRVLAEASIDADGKVVGVKIVSGYPILAKAAREAIMQWRYKPALLDGQPVASTTQVSVTFVRPRQ